jgi:hypothetical protein
MRCGSEPIRSWLIRSGLLIRNGVPSGLRTAEDGIDGRPETSEGLIEVGVVGGHRVAAGDPGDGAEKAVCRSPRFGVAEVGDLLDSVPRNTGDGVGQLHPQGGVQVGRPGNGRWGWLWCVEPEMRKHFVA